MTGLVYYLAAMNLFSFFLCLHDKRMAKRRRSRVPERALLLAGLAGGAFGLFFSMELFRHKTKHLKFRILVPLFAALWIAVIFFVHEA